MTYDEIQDSIIDWLMRPDLEDVVPRFIQMAELGFDRVLRTKEMLNRAQTEAKSQYLPLPEDWLASKNVQRMSDGLVLEFQTIEELDKIRWRRDQGQCWGEKGPQAFTYVGDVMELAPSPSEDNPAWIEIAYYRAIPKLGPGRSRNWISDKWPDLYIYGALVHSAPYLKDDERVAVWQQLRDSAILELNRAEVNARYSGASLTRKISNPMG